MRSVPCKLLAIFVVGFSFVLISADWRWVMSFSSDSGGKSLKYPTGAYFDVESGRYYVVDSGNGRLLAFSENGTYISQFDAGGRFLWPYDMRKEGKSKLWVIERGKNSLTYVDLKAKIFRENKLFFPDGGVIFPTRIEVKGGFVYLLDRSTGGIVVFDSKLDFIKLVKPKENFSGFIDFKLKGKKLWCLDPVERIVYAFGENGEELGRIELKSHLDFPISLEVDEDENIYILDRHAGDIKVFGKDGELKYTFLKPGQAKASLYYPIQVIFDGKGRLVVVEEGNGRVEVFER